MRHRMRIFGGVLALVVFLSRAADAGEPTPEECFGQGFASLLMKGACPVGGLVKVKMAGRPGARYKLFLSTGSGPTVLPGIGTVCLDWQGQRELVSAGRLNGAGLRSEWAMIPDGPEFEGMDLAFQFLAEDDEAPSGIAISNAYLFRPCDEGEEGEPCERGIRRLGYFMVLENPGVFPQTIRHRAFWTQGEHLSVGDLTFDFDPADPPALPISTDDEGLTIHKVESHGGFLILHAQAKSCAFANGRLPNECTFETSIGDSVVSVNVHTSCSVPIGAGSRFPPLFVTYLQDVRSAPEGDCDG